VLELVQLKKKEQKEESYMGAVWGNASAGKEPDGND
jgi:hypothetical protein